MRSMFVGGAVMVCCQAVSAGFESPAEGSIKSGLGLIRGWVCDAERVTYRIDGGAEYALVYGAERGDTQRVCGDRNNGFEKLVNWNDVGAGPHTIRIFADGRLLGESRFRVVTLGLGNYPRGLAGTYRLPGFPAAGQGTEITWSERDQNFMLSGVYSAGTDSGLTGYWQAEYDHLELCAGEVGSGIPERSTNQVEHYLEQSGDQVSVYTIDRASGEEVRTLDYSSTLADGVLVHPIPMMSPGILDWKGWTVFTGDGTAHSSRMLTQTDYGSIWCLYSISGKWTQRE